MSTSDLALRLAKRLELAGFDLNVKGESLVISPASKLTEEDKTEIRTLRDGLIKVVAGRCTGCRRLLDDKSACWKCWKRKCETCGRDTGSCFIANCLPCQAKITEGVAT